jgi:hypothetical protein
MSDLATWIALALMVLLLTATYFVRFARSAASMPMLAVIRLGIGLATLGYVVWVGYLFLRRSN